MKTLKLVSIHYHGSEQSQRTNWQRWKSFAIATLSDQTTIYFPEGQDFEDAIRADLNKRGVDTSEFIGLAGIQGYPPKPEAAELYFHNYGYEKPVELGAWEWSTTFGRWSRMVKFADGWHGLTYPKL